MLVPAHRPVCCHGNVVVVRVRPGSLGLQGTAREHRDVPAVRARWCSGHHGVDLARRAVSLFLLKVKVS